MTSTTGKQGNAAQFTLANSEYLNIADNASLSMGAGARMTACVWVKLDSKNSSLVQEFVAKGAANGTWEYFLRYDGRIDRFAFLVTSSGYAATLTEVRANTLGSPAIGQWYFVCGGYDGTNIWISINAGARDLTAFSSNIYDGTAELRIGSLSMYGNYLDGKLDELLLYKRSLSANEITWLYNTGSGRTYANLSLVPTPPTTYTYGNSAHKHAVTALSTGETYTYDANGNMTQRVENGQTYTQVFDAENRLISVTVNSQTTQFIYDGDGNLVKKIKPNLSKTIYVGGVYEVDKTGSTVTRTVTYYPAGGAMRINIVGGSNTLYYILKDHLGSASVVTDASGVTVGEQRYYPYGEMRFTSGTIYTDKLFTGQREMAGLGIYHYQARFYSPYLNQTGL